MLANSTVPVKSFYQAIVPPYQCPDESQELVWVTFETFAFSSIKRQSWQMISETFISTCSWIPTVTGLSLFKVTVSFFQSCKVQELLNRNDPYCMLFAFFNPPRAIVNESLTPEQFRKQERILHRTFTTAVVGMNYKKYHRSVWTTT